MTGLQNLGDLIVTEEGVNWKTQTVVAMIFGMGQTLRIETKFLDRSLSMGRDWIVNQGADPMGVEMILKRSTILTAHHE